MTTRTTDRSRTALSFCRAVLWDDLGGAPLPVPGGRWGASVPWALAALVFFAGFADLVQHYDTASGPAVALALARAAPVVLAATGPRTAWWAEFAAVVVTAAVTRPHSPAEPWPWAVTSSLSAAAVFVLVGSRAPRRALCAMWLEVLAAGAVLVVLVPEYGEWGGLLPLSVLLAVAAVTADALHGRGEARARLAVTERVSAAEQARATLLAERARIARELHDVVAHHMSVITVQADSAPYRLGGVSPEVAEEFAAIAAGARRSLGEMRRLLHVLRSEESPDGAYAPQPGLEDLAALVETTRRAGVDVRLDMDEGVPGDADLPATVGLSAYRVVQEALSNVVRHAPGARADVRVRRSDGGLRIDVVNSAPAGVPRAVEARAGGHGLVGMRERVAVLGGELTARSQPDGGFRVSAVLPLPGVS
ncbi:sensor histidine kinase [Streptomyces sp. RFCAC02]|uniref:sensor histidine kinase n=1 Tax=Streptomyces sp. RFCAC02 TaxID=2499143 RepID=UPI00101EFA4A|nr:sensor histidine kinase [Streptomyces sp. RFCAC02]